MENRNRTVWIVALILVGVLLCCCMLVVGTALTGILATAPLSRDVGFSRVEERSEQAFTVEEAPQLRVDNFAGDVTVQSGAGGQIRVVVTKSAMNSDALNRINVDLREDDDGVRIETSHPGINTNMSVDFEISVPADARLDLRTGAGNVEVDDVEGEISAHTGAGNVRVQGTSAPVALETGAGNINYEGEPAGDCTFQTGAGSITLSLPEDLNAEVGLTSGMGNVDVRGFDVEGQTSRTEVDGRIGSGEEATIEAHTGAGNVTLTRR